MYITVKGMSRQSIQRIKAMLLCIEYGILFVDTVNTKHTSMQYIECYAMSRLSILVFSHLIVLSIRCCVRATNNSVSTVLTNIAFYVLHALIFISTVSTKKIAYTIYNSIAICYICQHFQYRTRISNAFNAIYVDTVNTKHIHTFLPITFLIFN